GRGPKDAAELRPFLQAFGDPDDLLTSPNDNQPFVIIWGQNPATGRPTEYQGMFPILAYEQQGAGGRRAGGDSPGRPIAGPDEDFPKLKFLGGHKPAS